MNNKLLIFFLINLFLVKLLPFSIYVVGYSEMCLRRDKAVILAAIELGQRHAQTWCIEIYIYIYTHMHLL